MKPLLTSDLKIKFLGITPLLKTTTHPPPSRLRRAPGAVILNPQEIVALSGLATFKGKHIKELLKEIKRKDRSLEKTIKGILLKSSLIGHASIATTPVLSLTYEGSKFLDSALTGIVFSSSMVASGRRTETTKKDIVFPDKIFLNKRARKIYQEISEKIIKFFNFLLSRGVPKDEASKILQYGIYGTGIISLPIESIAGLKREYIAEKEWMPQEIGILLKKIEKATKKMGVDWIYTTRGIAPRNIYPYPNIFKDPAKFNIVRELRQKIDLSEGTKLISIDILITPILKKRLIDLGQIAQKTFRSLKEIKKNWPKLLAFRQGIIRDYNEAIRFRVLSSVPWRVWGEKKRHRTCPQVIESIYYCIGRGAEKFSQFENLIEKERISKKLTKEIEKVFSIPPSIKKTPQFLSEYLSVASEAFKGYKNLIKLGIKPREAIFLIPRGLKIDILQEYDLYNLLTGYYPLRLCQTVEEELRRITLKETLEIKKALAKRGYGWLNKFIGPKCEIIGFCPEVKSCGYIKGLVKNYDENSIKKCKMT